MRQFGDFLSSMQRFITMNVCIDLLRCYFIRILLGTAELLTQQNWSHWGALPKWIPSFPSITYLGGYFYIPSPLSFIFWAMVYMKSFNYLHFSFVKKSGAVFRPPSVKMFMLIMRRLRVWDLLIKNYEIRKPHTCATASCSRFFIK